MVGTILCLDVGGTYVRIGRYDLVTSGHAQLCKEPTWLDATTDDSRSAATFLERLRDFIHSSLEESDVAVAAALAGPVSSDGRVWALPTIAGSERIDLSAETLRERLDIPPLYLLNDMTAAAYGLLSAERQTFCVATIGSGLGVRLMIRGLPVLGDLGMAGEIGHVKVDFSADSPRCDCGGLGHLGGLASGRGVIGHLPGVNQERDDPEVADLFGDPFTFIRAYKLGERKATDAVRRKGTLLGRTLAPILTACGISDTVLMGGAVEAMEPDYARAVQTAIEECTWDVIRAQQPPRVTVEFDESLPLLGAGRFAAIRSGQFVDASVAAYGLFTATEQATDR